MKTIVERNYRSITYTVPDLHVSARVDAPTIGQSEWKASVSSPGIGGQSPSIATERGMAMVTLAERVSAVAEDLNARGVKDLEVTEENHRTEVTL